MAANFSSSGDFALNIYWLPETEPASKERSDPADEPSTTSLPLRELPPGPWRSSGGYLDYSDWPERERFAELDRAIQAGDRCPRSACVPAVHVEDAGPFRRCRAKIANGANCNAYFPVAVDCDG